MSDTREMNIDLGLVLKNVKVPSSMSDQEVLDHILRVVLGEGDPRSGINMFADVSYYVSSKIEENLDAIGSPIEVSGNISFQPKPEGDTRTPRQRSLDYQSKPEYTQGK